MNRIAALVALGLLSASAAAVAQDVPRDVPGFTEYVANALRKEVEPDLVSVKGPLTLGLGELQANLDRVYAFCAANAAACPAELERYVQAAAQVHRERNLPPSRDAVRVVIRTARYAEAASASMPGAGPPGIMPRPFVEGLVALPAIDTPRAIKMLGPKDSEKLGLSEQEAHALGLANLRRELQPLMDVAKVAGKGQIGQLVGDAFHPSRLLLHDTWAPLAKAQAGVLIVAMPTTDAVFYIGEDTPAAIGALRTLVRTVHSRAPNRLSEILVRWSEPAWQVVPP